MASQNLTLPPKVQLSSENAADCPAHVGLFLSYGGFRKKGIVAEVIQ